MYNHTICSSIVSAEFVRWSILCDFFVTKLLDLWPCFLIQAYFQWLSRRIVVNSWNQSHTSPLPVFRPVLFYNAPLCFCLALSSVCLLWQMIPSPPYTLVKVWCRGRCYHFSTPILHRSLFKKIDRNIIIKWKWRMLSEKWYLLLITWIFFTYFSFINMKCCLLFLFCL